MTKEKDLSDDIKNLDLWSEEPVYANIYNQRRSGLKGINNAHIIGVHKRYYDRDNTEGLSMNGELGPTRTWGYNNTDLYKSVSK